MIVGYLLVVAVVTAGLAAPAPAVVAPVPGSEIAPDDRIIDLNRASLSELLAFKGIGRMYAEKIMMARPFRSRSELVARHVVPVEVYLAIKHRLFVTPLDDGDQSRALEPIPLGMVDLNAASSDELAGISGIGRLYADRIVRGRPYRAEYELVSRRIMPLTAFQRIQGMIAVQR
jgi:DNA uptake protein ComE-like DNA-binding protein